MSSFTISIWRGNDTPPTNYHLWIYNDEEIRLYKNNQWITILDDEQSAETIKEILTRLTTIENSFNSATINNKSISSSPVLNSTDIKNVNSGIYINGGSSLEDNLLKIDTLLQTQIITE